MPQISEVRGQSKEAKVETPTGGQGVEGRAPLVNTCLLEVSHSLQCTPDTPVLNEGSHRYKTFLLLVPR